MKKGAKILVGKHDFSTFRSSSCGAKSPVRTMKKVEIIKSKMVKFTYILFLSLFTTASEVNGGLY